MVKVKISLEDVANLDFTTIIWIAAPVMFSLVAIESYFSYKQNKKLYEGKDFMSSTFIGVVNILLNGVMKLGVFGFFIFFYNLTPFHIPPTWWSYLLCFIALDFVRYWSHRIAHEQRFWWSTHVVHHNSEYYNLSTSFRLSWTQNLKIIFFLPVILMGFHPFVFLVVHQIAVLYQFWIHTEYIKKLPKPIEFIFTTPSHHRVHHSKNEKYIDKNYGSTLIIWDRLFGTFVEEVEKPIYGITKPINTYNPFTLVFHEWIALFKDLTKVKSIQEAYRTAFGSPVDYHKSELKKMDINSEEVLKK